MKSMDGRSVKSIFWPRENGEQKHAGNGISMVFEIQNLGEYGIDWVVVYKDGEELERHNAKFLESIVWEETLCANQAAYEAGVKSNKGETR